MAWTMRYDGTEVAHNLSLEAVDNLTRLYLKAADSPEPWFDLQGLDDNENLAITRVLASRHISLSFMAD
jgi:hypothetical protein